MRYLDYINQFHRVRRHSTKRITSSAADLYYHMLWIANRLNWKNPFNESTAMLLAELGMTDKTLDNARSLLIEAGLLAYTPGKKGTASAYELLTVQDYSTENFRSNGGRNGGELGGETGDLHKTKIKKEEAAHAAPLTSSSARKSGGKQPKKSTARADEVAALPLPHPGAEFTQRWADFLTSPKQAKKSLTAFTLMLKKLGKYPEAFAIIMLEAAIQGDWQGVENGGTAKAYADWQATQAEAVRRQPVRTTPHPGDGPLLNTDFLAQQQAREQQALADQNDEWHRTHNTDALFGYTQTAAEGLAQSRQGPDWERYLAEQAGQPPPDAASAA